MGATTNRNGLVGDYAAFAPQRMTQQEAIHRTKARRGEPVGPPDRVSREVARIGEYALVRHRLWSMEFVEASKALGHAKPAMIPESIMSSAAFGIVDARGRHVALIDVIEDDEGDPGIFFFLHDRNAPAPREVALRALRLLDVPPLRNSGADGEIQSAFAAVWDESGGGWIEREPVRLVRFSFERTCFGTDPVLRESIDVVVPAEAEYDIADADPDRADRARRYYRGAAMDAFEGMPGTGARPGFSSWNRGGQPVLVKALNGMERRLVPDASGADPEAVDEAPTGPAP